MVGAPIDREGAGAGCAEEVNAAGELVVGGEDGVAVFLDEDDQLSGADAEGGLELGGGLADARGAAEDVAVAGLEG